MTYGLTDAGYVAPRMADFLTLIRSSVETRLTAALGYPVVIDWERDVFISHIVAEMAERLGDLGDATQSLYDAFDPENASGYGLDILCLLVGVRRIGATYGAATATLGGTVGTVVPEGSLVEGGGDDGRARWEVSEDATIGALGTVDVIVTATERGRIEAGPGEITKIVTPVSGWSTVTNADAAEHGDDRETDEALRRRRQQSLQRAGSGSHNALIGTLLALETVSAAVVIDNDTAASVVSGGVSLDPHSVAIIVHPSTLTDEQAAEVALAIYGHGLFGTKTMGSDVVAPITDRAGGTKTIRFDYATELPVTVAVSLTLKSGYVVADVEDEITELIVDYFSALGVGDPVRRLALLALVSTVEGVTGADITLDGAASDVSPELSEIATLSGGAPAVT